MRRLLIRPGAIGDFILSLPALAHLQAGYTEIWASSRNLPLARFADRARAIADTGLDLLGIPEVDPPIRLLEDLRGFDSIVSWYGANRPEFRQATTELGLPFRFHHALPPGGTIHAADYYLRQVGGEGEAIPRLDCPSGDGGFVAIHPFSGSPKKNWPLERYLELSRRLSSILPVRWIVDRGAWSVDRGAWNVDRGTWSVEGVEVEPPVDDLYELACKLARARLYIGNDSGITHLAAAAGTRVLALFGPSDPALWAPRGPCVQVLCAQSIESIGLDQVRSTAQKLLG